MIQSKQSTKSQIIVVEIGICSHSKMLVNRVYSIKQNEKELLVRMGQFSKCFPPLLRVLLNSLLFCLRLYGL